MNTRITSFWDCQTNSFKTVCDVMSKNVCFNHYNFCIDNIRYTGTTGDFIAYFNAAQYCCVIRATSLLAYLKLLLVTVTKGKIHFFGFLRNVCLSPLKRDMDFK